MEWQESKIAKNILTIREQENTLANVGKNLGVTFVNGENGEISGVAGRVKGRSGRWATRTP
ncbi:hypothetical protein ACLB1O_31220 [Escherichia coli]